MAGDWIKMRADLRTHPKVVRLSSALRADRLRTVGGLHAVWCLFDAHSTDGSLDGYTLEAVDDLIGWPGFAAAMRDVDWLAEGPSGAGLYLPEFDTHNGASAKRRAQEADRKRREREEAVKAEAEAAEAGRKASASDADKKRTREEERREEKENPPTPRKRGEGEGRFPEFWMAWPATDRKVDRKGCLSRWKTAKLDEHADLILAHIATMKGTRKWSEGFEPAPLRYLRGEHWGDGVVVQAHDIFAGAR